MDLTKLTDRPELTVPIGGRDYDFSEIPIGKLSDLQDFIRKAVPHPLEALKGHLDGFSDRDRDRLLDEARAAGAKWPPQVGTAEGAAALLGTEAGQVEALRVGLSVHHPEMTADDAGRLFRQLRKETLRLARAARKAKRDYDGEGTVRRIFAVLFGLDPDEEPIPES